MPVELIPIFAIMMVFGIPLAAILTHHQRKMAELIHGRGNSAEAYEVAQLRAEVAQLRDRLNQQTLMLDSVQRAQSGPPPAPELTDRIG